MRRHILLLNHEVDIHFSFPRRVEGWVDLVTAVSVQSMPKSAYRNDFREKRKLLSAPRFKLGTSCAVYKHDTARPLRPFYGICVSEWNMETGKWLHWCPFAGERVAPSVHISVETGGLCVGVRHGVRYSVRCATYACHVRDCSASRLGSTRRQSSCTLQNDRQAHVRTATLCLRRSLSLLWRLVLRRGNSDGLINSYVEPGLYWDWWPLLARHSQ